MAKIVVRSLDAERKRTAKRGKLRVRRMQAVGGKLETIYYLDFADKRIGSQFGEVFQRAVNKARRENKRIIGTADLEPNL